MDNELILIIISWWFRLFFYIIGFTLATKLARWVFTGLTSIPDKKRSMYE